MPNQNPSEPKFHTIVIDNDLAVARQHVVKPILAAAAKQGYGKDDQFALRLGLEEAISNAYRHGNRADPTAHIHVRWTIDNQAVTVYVSDEGSGFDPTSVPDPTTAENREKPSGRGLMLMKAYMTELQFNEQGNEVCLVKVRKNSNLRSSA